MKECQKTLKCRMDRT